MPIIARFYGILIKMYFREHGVPHFHALYGEFNGVFNIDKLDWINGLYIREMSLMELTEKCLPYLPQMPIEELLKIVALYHERLKKLSEINHIRMRDFWHIYKRSF
ncbi:MAG: DUF4160 domain-containing protein [Candidatus Moranbacteria bacterium]|nr:DUF4160 domain-containing protein [Candidatus Moranbacteria bacterium]